MNRFLALRSFTCLIPQLRLQTVQSSRIRLYFNNPICCRASISATYLNRRQYSSSDVPKDSASPSRPPVNDGPSLTFDEELAQLSFYQRYKKLLKEYWYILLPTHFATSAIWFTSSYLVARSGIMTALLDFNILPESIAATLRDGHLGSLALALALYKVISPLRYMSTVWIAVPTVRILVRKGKIKPLPKLASSSKLQDEFTNIRNRIVKKRGTR